MKHDDVRLGPWKSIQKMQTRMEGLEKSLVACTNTIELERIVEKHRIASELLKTLEGIQADCFKRQTN